MRKVITFLTGLAVALAAASLVRGAQPTGPVAYEPEVLIYVGDEIKAIKLLQPVRTVDDCKEALQPVELAFLEADDAPSNGAVNGACLPIPPASSAAHVKRRIRPTADQKTAMR